ncbi:MAG: hypothetical protein JWO62_2266 [Acidimicrobiaceae bacterium]|nr:hypothetical protein [Acidimicrobiaceae bacterium]
MTSLPLSIQMLLPLLADGNSHRRAWTLILLQGPGPEMLRTHIQEIHNALGSNSPGIPELNEIIDLSGAAVSDASDTIPNQHYLSQATQRRFVEIVPGRGKVVRYVDLATGDSDVGKTEDLGNEFHFIPIDSKAAEKLWQTVESRINDPIDSALAGRTLTIAQERLLKDYVALHFARNPQLLEVHHKSVKSAVENQLEELARTPFAAAAFYRKTGLHVAQLGGEAARIGARELQGRFTDLYERGALFRLTAQRIFEDVKDRIDPLGVELVTPASPSKEFLVGDVPALTVQEATGRVGVLGGVAVDEAEYLFMALAPQLVVALGPSDGYSSADDTRVDRLNNFQVNGARERVFFRPSAAFAVQIEAWRPASET